MCSLGSCRPLSRHCPWIVVVSISTTNHVPATPSLQPLQVSPLLPPPEPSARPDERAGRRMLLFSSTTSLLGDVGEAGAAGAGGPSSELEVRAMSLQAFEVLDHGC